MTSIVSSQRWTTLWLTCLFLCCMPILASAKSKTWTSQQDWAQGRNVNTDLSKTPGDLRIKYDPSKQQYKSTPFIYIPNSSRNTIVKMDTRNGLIQWTYNLAALKLGSNPSRTTVDGKGNVWVGLRNGNYVVAIDPKGKYLGAGNAGSGPRAITIDKNDNVWAGGYYGKKVVQISGKTYKVIRTVTHPNLCAYGAATDNNGDIWIANRCKHNIVKIQATTGRILGFYPAHGVYGIAADKAGNVWVAGWDSSRLYRFRASDGRLLNTYTLPARGRGVGVDANGQVWVACSHNNSIKVTRMLVSMNIATGRMTNITSVGLHTIGVAIGSSGHAWANSYDEGYAYKIDLKTKRYVGKYPVCDTTGTRPCANTGCTRCTNPNQAKPYTYSDMTGFQLQVVVAPSSASWNQTYDAKCKANFSNVVWSESRPAGTQIAIRARTASTAAGLARAQWGPYVTSGANLQVAPNRFIELNYLLKTQDSRVSPSVRLATLNFGHYPEICDGIDNDCNGKIDENWSDLGQACSTGQFSCKRTGKRICAPNKRSTVCSAQVIKAVPEICDGKDNDCDGKVDEDFPALGQSCAVGRGDCNRAGKYVCKKDKSGTECGAKAGVPQQERCDGKDNDCDGKVDEDFPSLGSECSAGKGICYNKGKYICTADGKSTECGAKAGQPRQETCNGKDDDCDGKTDEDWLDKGKRCEVGKGACKKSGNWECRANGTGLRCSATARKPQPETCNGIDDDCNGNVDENLDQACRSACGAGVKRCVNGRYKACDAPTPKPETCDGKDNDCNGLVDDGQFRKCSTPCGTGRERCVNGTFKFCDAKKPQPEVCDGIDNDCNGKTDDGIKPRKCQGDCGEGTAVCQNGKLSGCSGPRPEKEICDGKDNDCNGKIDDKVTKTCKTACGEGTQTCRSGKWLVCNAAKERQEICDGKDNDCDGKADNGAKCPTGMQCRDGKCLRACSGGECPKGMRCQEGRCQEVTDVCKDIKCPKGKACISGQCVDACFKVSCEKGQTCQNGQCQNDDCYTKGCPKEQRCVSGQCEKDPCSKVQCPSDQFCRDGKCIDSCATVSCNDGETCVDGKCKKDPTTSGPCAKVKCKNGERCEQGKCVGDPCKDVQCAKGYRCEKGQCKHDGCVNIQCPTGQVCRGEQCVKPTKPNPGEENPAGNDEKSSTGNEKPSAGQETTANLEKGSNDAGAPDTKTTGTGTKLPPGGKPGNRYGDGGCGCQSADGQIPVWWLLLLFALPFIQRQRSQR